MASFFYPDLPATVFIQLLTCTTGLFRTIAPSAWQARKDEGRGEGEKGEKEESVWACAFQIVRNRHFQYKCRGDVKRQRILRKVDWDIYIHCGQGAT